jgi:N4-gp56 family major capsid protein
MTAYETGTIYGTSATGNYLPASQRSYYEALLLETLRTKSILVPYCTVKEDFRARDTGIIIYTEVMDTDPDFSALAEDTLWLTGAHLDSRSVQIALEIHGDALKISDYNELLNYWANGDLRGLVRGKLGQNMVDCLDLLARNAFLGASNITYAGSKTSRATLLQTDLFDPELGEVIRVHLEENEVPGIASVDDGGSQTIVCVTTPRVCHDIRTAAGSKWLEVQEYLTPTRKLNSEVGMWGGVRYVKTNRNKLFNFGAQTTVQTTISGPTVAGQGAKVSQSPYTVGQSGATAYIAVAKDDSFAVGDIVTLHASGTVPTEADGTVEVRKIVQLAVSGESMAFDRPLMKVHAKGAKVTKGITLHASMFMGGPAIVYGVGERPNVLVPPKIDDMQMVQRYSWRGFLKFQMFRPEFLELVLSGGSTT